MSSEGVNPLPSDSRRRPDRYALEVRLLHLQTLWLDLSDVHIIRI